MNLQIERLSIDDLTFDPGNARKHSEANLSAIAESLKLFGQRKPVVVTAANLIVAGNGTVEAAASIGLTDIDVVRVPEDWTADQVKAFALADNRTAELAEWDSEVLAKQLLELSAADFPLDIIGFEATPVANFEQLANEENPQLDERVQHECPNCLAMFVMLNGKPALSE